jgi:hypothetical protein
MFDDARPARIKTVIWVAAFDNERLVCARCTEQVLQRDVAFYTRTYPGHPFDPWCNRCAHTLVRWAGIGALSTDGLDNQEAEDRMRDLLSHGDY